MTIVFRTQWGAYSPGQRADLGSTEEARLIALGLADDYSQAAQDARETPAGELQVLTAGQYASPSSMPAGVLYMTAAGAVVVRRAGEAVWSPVSGDGPQISGLAAHPMIAHDGADTGVVDVARWANYQAMTGFTFAGGTDARGQYVDMTYLGGGALALAQFPTPLNLSSGGTIVLAVEYVTPSAQAAPSCLLAMHLSGSATLTNYATRTYQFNTGGASGQLRPGLNIFSQRVDTPVAVVAGESTDAGYINSTWTRSGTYSSQTTAVTHVAIGWLSGTVEVGAVLRLRALRVGHIGMPYVVWGMDDAHRSVLPIYRRAASLGLRGVIPVVSSYSQAGTTYINASELRELHALGMTCLNHTTAHQFLGASTTYQQARDAIEPCQAWLVENGLGHTPILVWPGGVYNDNSIAAATDLGYTHARSAGKRDIVALASLGVENPYRLGSFDLGGQTLEAVINNARSMLSDAGSQMMWLYGHVAIAGNPPANATAPTGNDWHFGWHQRLVSQLAMWQGQGLCRTLSGAELHRVLSGVGI
jgi:Polysaccharide deacetylase